MRPILSTCVGFLFIVVTAILNSGGLVAADRIALLRHFHEPPSGQSRPVLVRELFRQAVLIAASEELGLQIADEVLGDSIESREGTLVLMPEFQVPMNFPNSKFEIYVENTKVPLWTHTVPNIYTDSDVGGIARDMHEFSKTAFPNALAKFNLKSQRSPVKQDVSTRPSYLDSANESLVKFDILPQCVTIRKLHAGIKEFGVHAESLGMLARAYGNLYQLIDGSVDGVPQAVAARAMLYGERAVDLFPDSDVAHWSRGYAHAMVGSLLTADKELERNVEMQPIWAKIARHVVRFESEALDELLGKQPKEDKPLIAFCTYLTHEPSPLNQFGLNAMQKAYANCPGNIKLLTGIYQSTGPGLAGSAINEAIEKWKLAVNRYSKSKDVSKLANSAKGYRTFIEQLEKEADGDLNPFSNHAIARIIDDQTLLMHLRNVIYLTRAIGVDTTDLVEEYRRLLGKHRHWSLIEIARDVAQARGGPGTNEFFERIGKVRVLDSTPVGLNLDYLYAIGSLHSLPQALHGSGQVERMSANAWELFRYLRRNINVLQGTPDTKTFTDMALEIAPHSPYSHGYALFDQWKTRKGQADDLLKRFGDHSMINLAIVRNSILEKDFDLAIVAIQKVIEVSPEFALYVDLAGIYKEKGDDKKWAETLEQFLDYDSPDLRAASIMVELADYYLDKGNDQLLALRMAKGAASTGSHWGLACLARAHIALEEWDEAERLIQANAHRYGQSYEWYQWCLFYDRGDFEAAKALAVEYEKSIVNKPSQENAAARMFIRKIAGLPIEQPLISEVTSTSTTAWGGLHALILHWEDNDITKRDHIVKFLVDVAPIYEKNPEPNLKLIELSLLFADLIKNKASTQKAKSAFDKLLEKYPDDPNMGYFMGRFLDLSGAKDEAVSFYKQCAKGKDINRFNASLARFRLREDAMKAPVQSR